MTVNKHVIEALLFTSIGDVCYEHTQQDATDKLNTLLKYLKDNNVTDEQLFELKLSTYLYPDAIYEDGFLIACLRNERPALYEILCAKHQSLSTDS